MKLEKLKTKTKIYCGDFLNATMATDLKSLFIEALNEKKNLEINLENVESVDTLCLQLILSAKKTCNHEKLNFVIEKSSENFENRSALIGLKGYLYEDNS